MLAYALLPLLVTASTYPVDRGAIADVVFDLGGKWGLSNGTAFTTGQVPGDLITDLENGGLIGDPLFELNFKTPVWDYGNWTYTCVSGAGWAAHARAHPQPPPSPPLPIFPQQEDV